jgi:hypothetical protein
VIDDGRQVLFCPQVGALCTGSNALADSGYFTVIVNNSIAAYECTPGACDVGDTPPLGSAPFPCVDATPDSRALGLVAPYCTGTNACAGNRTGFMCGACSPGYGYTSSDRCTGTWVFSAVFFFLLIIHCRVRLC